MSNVVLGDLVLRGFSKVKLDNVHDALLDFDENSLPEAMHIGTSLMYVRGGNSSKYDTLNSFRRTIYQNKNVNSQAASGVRRHFLQAPDPSQKEKIKLLTDLLGRLESLVDKPKGPV